MKKILTLLTVILLVLSLSACKNKEEDEEDTSLSYEATIRAVDEPFSVDGSASFEVYVSNYEDGPVFMILPDIKLFSYVEASIVAYYDTTLEGTHTAISIPLMEYGIGGGTYCAAVYSSRDSDAVEITSITFTVEEPTMYSREYYENLYPEKTINSFSFNVNGTPFTYYYSEEDIKDLDDWLFSEFNYDGWHYLDGDIVNEEETINVEGNSELFDGAIINTYNYSYSSDGDQKEEFEEGITRTDDQLFYTTYLEEDGLGAYFTMTFTFVDDVLDTITETYECNDEKTVESFLETIKEDEDVNQSTVKTEGLTISYDLNSDFVDLLKDFSMDEIQELLEE